MRTVFVFSLFFCTSLAFTACKKDNPANNPIVTVQKKWLVKDIRSTQGDISGKLYHTIMNYNDTGLITRVDGGLGNVNTPDQFAVLGSYNILYDSKGKITAITANKDIGRLVLYQSAFVIVTRPDNFDSTHIPTGTFSFNLHSQLELDALTTKFPPNNPLYNGNNLTISFIYAPNGTIQAETTTILNTGVTSDIFGTVGAAPAPAAFPNPLQTGTTLEQRFIYFYFLRNVLGDFGLLGSSWSNSIYEGYVYNNGQRKTVSHFYNNYTLDSNKNPVSITQSAALDTPNFGTFTTSGTPITVTYEQH